jgi:hypothetical protein
MSNATAAFRATVSFTLRDMPCGCVLFMTQPPSGVALAKREMIEAA